MIIISVEYYRLSSMGRPPSAVAPVPSFDGDWCSVPCIENFEFFKKLNCDILLKFFLPLSILEMFWFCYALVGHFASHPSKSTLKPENYHLYHPKFIRVSDIYKLFVMSNKSIYLHTYTNKM